MFKSPPLLSYIKINAAVVGVLQIKSFSVSHLRLSFPEMHLRHDGAVYINRRGPPPTHYPLCCIGMFMQKPKTEKCTLTRILKGPVACFSGLSAVLKQCITISNDTQALKKRDIQMFSYFTCQRNTFYPVLSNTHSRDFFFSHYHAIVPRFPGFSAGACTLSNTASQSPALCSLFQRCLQENLFLVDRAS